MKRALGVAVACDGSGIDARIGASAGAVRARSAADGTVPDAVAPSALREPS